MTDKKLKIRVKSIPTTISMNSKTKKWSGDAIVHINGKGVELLSDIDEQLDEFTNMLNNKTFNNIDDNVVNLSEEIAELIAIDLKNIVTYSTKLHNNKDFYKIPSLIGLVEDLQKKYIEYQVLNELLED